MRSKFLRELIDRIDLGRETLYEEYSNKIAAPGTLEEADTCFVLGRYWFLTGYNEESIKYYNQALEKYRALGDEAGECYTLIYNFMNYREIHDSVEARRMIRSAHDIAVEISDNYAVLFTILCSLTLYSLEHRDEDAESLRIKAGQMIEDIGHPKLKGDYHNNTGQSNLMLEQYEKALYHINLGYQAYLEYYKDPKAINVMISRVNRAYAYIGLGRWEEAMEEISEIRGYVEEYGYDSNLTMQVYQALVDIYEERRDYEEAYKAAKKSIQYGKRWLEESTKRPRKKNLELKQQLEISLQNLIAKSEALKQNNADLEVIIRNNELIKQIGSKLTSTYDLDKIFEIVYTQTQRVMMFNSVTMGLIEGDSIVVSRGVFRGVERVDLPIEIPLKSKDFMFSYCIRHDVDLKIDDRADYDRYISSNDKTLDPDDEELQVNHSAIYCRLLHDGRAFGVVSIQNSEHSSFSEYDFNYMKTIAAFMSVAIVNSLKNEQIREKANQLESLALRDPLTRLENRRAFNMDVQRLEDSNRSFSLLFADMNHLKMINDNIGHEEGDRYLCVVAEILKEKCGNNKVYRLSGDEFASLIPEYSREEVYDLVKQIKEACRKRSVGEYPVSVAVGCSFSIQNKSVNRMFISAEARMYKDKHDYYMKFGDSLKRREIWLKRI